jgi:hypothetical protein
MSSGLIFSVFSLLYFDNNLVANDLNFIIIYYFHSGKISVRHLVAITNAQLLKCQNEKVGSHT